MKTKLLVSVTVLLFAITASKAQPALQWQRNYGGSGNDSAYSIQPTTDGGYIIAGQSNSTGGDVTGNHGGIDYWVAKLDGAGNILWQKSFGGSGSDIAKCIQQTSDGGYIIAGISNSIDGDVTDHGRSYESHFGGFYYYDVPPVYEPWIVKLDNTGVSLWAVCLHTVFYSDDDVVTWYYDNYVNTIIQTSDGGYLVGGNTALLPNDPSPGTEAAMLVKLTNTGAVSWSKNIETGTRMDIRSVVETSTGYVVAGYSDGFGSHGGVDMLIFKTGFLGNWVWGMHYGGSNNDKAYNIQKTTDGGFIVAGVTNSSNGDLLGAGNHGGDDYCLVKINSAGGVMWSKCFGGTARDIARAVVQTADGGYLVAGYSFSTTGQVTGHSPGSQSDYWIAKVDYAGTFISGKCYGGSSNDNAWSIAKTLDGGFIIAGSSASADAGFTNKGGADYWLLKLYGCGIVSAPVAPTTQLFSKCTLPKVSNLAATGTNLKWYAAAKGGAPLAPSTALSSHTYYVSQTTVNGCESRRLAVAVTVLICIFPARAESSGLEQQETELASANVFPNPSSGERVTVNIQTANKTDNAIIQVMDLKGKLLLQETATNSKGYIQQIIDVTKLPSAIYIVRFTVGTQSGNIKLIIAK